MRCQKHFVMVITNAISVASIVYQQKFDIYYMHSSKRPLSMQTFASVPTSKVYIYIYSIYVYMQKVWRKFHTKLANKSYFELSTVAAKYSPWTNLV